MKINRIAILVVTILSAGAFASGVTPGQVRQALTEAGSLCASNRWDYWTMDEAMNFEWFRTNAVYCSLSSVISNDWEDVLASLPTIATNNLERLLVLGVGKQYDEDFYIDYMEALSDMKTNNLISAKEFAWARASTRYDLMSCLARRYQEPKVIGLVNKYKTSIPSQTNLWNSILSGAAYTNYLEEIEIGLWQ